MSRSQFGNNLLYLLSEKRYIKSNQLNQYIDVLLNAHKKSYWKYSLVRNLSTLWYLYIKDDKGNTVLKITPPMLIELPFTKPNFLLTGARSPELLKVIKSNAKIEIKKTLNTYFPDTIIVRPENIQSLENWLEETAFQGNKLADYIKIYKNPVSWKILEDSEDVKVYEESLEWSSGDKSEIREFFDIDNLKFRLFTTQQNLEHDLSLVKICHHGNLIKYYLFRTANEDKVAVNLDWGRFLISQKLQHSILQYNRKTFELRSKLRLPAELERGLALLSGEPPKELNSDTQQNKKSFTFKNVPYKIAKLVANKLGQELNDIVAKSG